MSGAPSAPSLAPEPGAGALTSSSSRDIARGADWPSFAIVVVLLLIAIGLFSWSSWRQAYNFRLKTLQGLVALTQKDIDAYFTGMDNALSLLGDDLAERKPLAQVRPTLHRFQNLFPELREVSALSADGRCLESSDGMTSTVAPPWFEEARATLDGGAMLAISRAYQLHGSTEWVTYLSRRVKSAPGTAPVGAGPVIGYVSAAMAVARTQAFWRDFPLPEDAGLGLARDDGYVIARYPLGPGISEATRYTTPLRGPHAPFIKRNRSYEPISIEGVSKGQGENTLYLVQRLRHFPLTVYLRNPSINFVRYWWQDMAWAYVMLILVLLITAALYFWTARRESAWDIERARRTSELEAANEQLAAFTYTVSHDLRAPVRAIDGFTHLLVDGARERLKAEQLALAGRIEENTHRMSRLIDGLLEFSQQSRRAIVPEPIDMEAMVHAILTQLQGGGAVGRAEVKVEPLPRCRGDALLIRQVWTNLLSNALKYSQYVEQPRVAVFHDGRAYAVSDNGVGFDMKHADKLFGVFSRLHHLTEFDGTGVGLAIVRRIVERHGGRIWAVAAVGEGATFYFTLGA